MSTRQTTGMGMCCAAMIVCLALGTASAAMFINGGFEDGTTNGWTCRGGLWSDHPGWPQNFNDYTNPAQFKGAIVTPGNDPIVGTNLNRVFNGNYALRVNDSTGGCHVSTAMQTVSNWTATNIYFAWAAVLQSSHGSNDSDNFSLQLRDETLGSNLITRTYSSYNAGPIFTITNQGPSHDWSATPWQIEQLDVSAYIGDTFTVSVLASDCAAGGHAGYVYVDCFGGSIPTTNTTVTITVNVNPAGAGSATGGGTYPIGTNIVLTATPSNGWRFVNWNDGATNNPYTVTAPAADITYTANFTNSTSDGWLAIQVTPTDGTWQLTAPAGYTGPTSGAGSLSALSAPTGSYALAWGALSGYVAPSNQTQFVTAGSTTLFSAVYLQISTNIGTPSGVNATEGTYTNFIQVAWQGVTGATGYEIWRSQTNDTNTAVRIADIAANQSIRNQRSEVSLQPSAYSLQSAAYYYDDYNINPVYAYYYWVRARTSSLISPMSYVGMGYAALLPDQKTGTADIYVSDLVYLPVNATNLSHAGTVSCRLANLGPDALNAAGVAFDFHMGTNSANMVWIGSAQNTYSLAAGAEKLVILTPTAKQGLSVRGDLSGIQTVQVTGRHLSTLNDPNLANNTTTAAGTVRIKTSGVNSIGRGLNDYDGDGKADGCLYQSVLGRWYGELSGMRYSEPVGIGDVGMGWTPAPGDYDGDGITDVAAYESASGQWLIRFSSDLQVVVCEYGGPEFRAVPCDIDGDAKTDPVIYRDEDGYLQGAASSIGYISCYTSLGGTGCQTVLADYDGDRLADPAVYTWITGQWSIGLSGSGYQIITGLFGGIDWLPVPADYDGDGLTDPAIYAPVTAYWQVLLSGSLETQGCYTWWGGAAGNIYGTPVPADYDGDGKADLAVYHRETGVWELFLSTRGYLEFSGDWGGTEYHPAIE